MTSFTLPTSRPITQNWGMEFNLLNGVYYPNGFYNSLGWKGHNGIDYGCFIGDPVEAVCDGVIEYVGPGNNHPLLSGGGNTILLRNDELGIRFEYLHLSQQNVYTGQRVKAWDVIGESGDSGVSSAPHLHLGAIPVANVNQNDGWRGRVDPTPYLYGGSIQPAGQITVITQEEDMAVNTPTQLQEAVQTVLRDNDLVRDGRSVVEALTQLLDSTDIIGERDRKQLEELATLKELLGQLVKSTAANQSTYYLKGDKAPEVYALDVASGSLRHIGSAEFGVVTAIGIYKTVDQAKVDALLKGK